MWDVFLAHNSIDKSRVRELKSELDQRGYRSFLDDSNLRYDRLINPQLEKALRETLVVAICFGDSGMGPVHQLEADISLNDFMHGAKSLVTVILPGADESARPSRLRGFPPITFKASMDETEPLRKLAATIDVRRNEVEAERRARESRELDERGKTALPPTAVTHAAKDGMESGAIGTLRALGREKGINFLIGPLTGVDTTECLRESGEFMEGGPVSRATGEPSPQDIVNAFMGDFDLTESEVALLPLETIASWCWHKRGSTAAFEQDLRKFLARRHPSGVVFYQQFARLLKVLADRPQRGRRDLRPMVFTTNLGTSLERELIRAGVSFSRIVVKLPIGLDVRRFRMQDESANVAIYDLGNLDREGKPQRLGAFGKDDLDDALRAIEDVDGTLFGLEPTLSGGTTMEAQHLSFDDMEGCVIFKYHGSIDVPESCTITSDQLFKLTGTAGIVPNAVISRLRSNPSVLFGTSILLTQVQQVLQAVLWEAFRTQTEGRYLVPRAQRFDGWMYRLEERLSDSVKRIVFRLGLQEVGGGQRKFVRQMTRAIEDDRG